jgi:hypothetical protein
MMAAASAMVDRSRGGGRSLHDAGYDYVGLDDNYQALAMHGP